MKAIITVDVPEHQIGQEVSVYFKDTMCIKGTCESETEVYAKHDEEVIKETVESIWGKPCADAVSRQAVLEILQDYVFEEDEIESVTDECQNNMAESIARNIVQLPSVNPQEPKTGYWIYTPIKRLIDDEECKYITDYRCSCSKCGSDFGFQKMSDAYCKYCGSRMVEPHERENEE